jgi:hypothetical protein
MLLPFYYEFTTGRARICCLCHRGDLKILPLLEINRAPDFKQEDYQILMNVSIFVFNNRHNGPLRDNNDKINALSK